MPTITSYHLPARRVLAASIGVALSVASLGIAAQDASEPTAEDAKTLREVQVSAEQPGDASTEYTGMYAPSGPSATASGLTLKACETPQSISVITHQQIDDLGLQSIDDVLLHTTGVTAATAAVGGGYQFTARGFNITNMQVDGLQGSYREAGRGPFNASVLDSALYDRVEIVRGATGLVTGIGDPSATVNMIRKRPGKEFAASALVAAGSWGHRRVVGDIGGPLTQDGRLRARLIGAHTESDSFRWFESNEVATLSGTLELDLAPRTMLTLGHDYQRTDQSGLPDAMPLFDSAGNRIDLPREMSLVAPWTYWNKGYNNSFVYLDHAFDNGWKAKLAYNHQKNTGDVSIIGMGSGLYPNADGSGITLRPNLAANGYRYQDTVQAQASGPFELFGRTHQLALGASTMRNRDTAHTLGFASSDQFAIGDIESWDGSMPQPEVVWSGAWTRTHTRQGGLYASARLSLADPLNLIVGARLSDYKTYRNNYDASGAFTGTNAELRNRRELTPFLGITYDLTPALTTYASYAEIFKPQSYRDKNNDYLDPITGNNIEVGIKADLLNERLHLNAAIFQAEQDNLAVIDDSVPANSLPDGSQAYLSSGKGNQSRGFELEATGFLSRNWQVFAAYSNTRTKNAEGEAINTYIPRQMVKLGTNYQFTGRLHGLSLGSTVHWHDRRDAWTAGRAITIPGVGTVAAPQHGSYATVGLHVGYRIKDHWQATLNVNNLFDKHYYDNFVSFRAMYGAPRNAQVTLRYQW